ncbi:hypothetical protein [Pseudonocardia sp. TRM90224]|uniref:hypothetical protein n=1 Tax=Pseudonocardia sp. TRM90224 TaxID=2812678 RepID=UPI001E5632D4|nr:hypothetical protein [Pseudonocardia sp. TRM90224]
MPERTIPILPCRALDDVVPFYQALGFVQTYRQDRPYPCLSMERNDIALFFGGIEGFDPEQSYASVIIVSDDTAALFDAFAAGLRGAYGKLPQSGIPRITRPRRKQGMAGGFTVVDPGGNWLRVSAKQSADDESPHGRLERAVRTAARQADSRGYEGTAISVLEKALARHTDAPAVERVGALVFLAELRMRVGEAAGAAQALAELRALDLDESQRAAVAGEFATAAEIEEALRARVEP